MKVVAINSSPRKNGNTFILLNHVIEEIKKAGIETEIIQTAGLKLEGCNACLGCYKNLDCKCVIKDDMQPIIDKIFESDGIILGSPTYFADITSELKAIIDRVGFVAVANGHKLDRKIGAGVIAVRRAGAIHGLATINNFFLINGMIIPGSTYWNLGVGRDKGDVEQDEEGIATMKNLGINFAWILRQIETKLS